MKKATKTKAKRRPKGSRKKRGPRTKRIRLGCIYCDRDDYDGVDRIPRDWAEVTRVQSYAESIKEVDLNDRAGTIRAGGICFWETHTGICPECQALEAAEDSDA